MKSSRIIFFTLIHFLVYCHLTGGQSSSKRNFDFNFTGYKRQNGEFLLKECPQNPKENFVKTKNMIDSALQKNALEIPTTNKGKPHVQCVKDPVMGNVVKLTIYKDDNDSTNLERKDRQRMEMKGEVEGTKGTTFVYAWWFKLDPKMKNSDDFYHIFQIKAGGTSTKFPLATFTLTNKDKFHLKLNYLKEYGDKAYKLLDLHEVKGKWIQVFVEAVYKKKSEGGKIRVTMKDEKGKDLVKEMTIQHEMWWEKAIFRPKWGLYRKKSSAYQPSDWQLFQNVQIWKKI